MNNEAELGIGDYTAELVNGVVIIHATGETPTSGYRIWLQQMQSDVFPPEYRLYWEAPGGIAADVMTPFQVHVSFSAQEEVSRVTVHDADGAHEISVDRVEE